MVSLVVLVAYFVAKNLVKFDSLNEAAKVSDLVIDSRMPFYEEPNNKLKVSTKQRSGQNSHSQLSNYISKISALKSEFKGSELQLELIKLCFDASKYLNFDQLHELMTSISDLGVWDACGALLGKKYLDENGLTLTLQWLKTTTNNRMYNSALHEVAINVKENEIDEFVKFLNQHCSGLLANSCYMNLLSGGDLNVIQKLAELVNTKKIRILSASSFASALGNLARNKVADAAQFVAVAETINDPLLRLSSLREILRSTSKNDPEKSAEILLEFRNESDRSTNVDVLIDYWFVHDSLACGKWINDLADEKLKNRASYEYGKKLAEYDPESAIKWISSISDLKLYDKARDEIMMQVKISSPQLYNQLKLQAK